MFLLNFLLASMLLVFPQKAVSVLLKALTGIVALNAISTLIGFFADKNKYNSFGYTFLYFLINMGVVFFALHRPQKFATFIFAMVGGWIALTSIFRIIKGLQYKSNGVWGAYRHIVLGSALFLYGTVLMFWQGKHVLLLLTTTAIYLYLYGGCFLYDLYLEIYQKERSLENRYRYVQISMPALPAALIPTKLLKTINTVFKEEDARTITQTKPNLREPYEAPLEIFVHSAEDAIGKMGHVDLRILDTVLSFGNYDPDSYKLWGLMGEGVLEVVQNKKAYIDFCIEHSKKTVVGFGLALSPEQAETLKGKIRKLLQGAYPWQPKAATEKKAVLHSDELDYASALYKATHAKFYKFKTGKFKTFTAFTTNCVILANEVLGALGTDVIAPEGFVTPGTFYELLNEEFCKKSGFVLTRTIYRNKENVGKKAKVNLPR